MQNLLLQIVLRIIIYTICLTFVCVPVFSQNGNLKFEHISLLQGLSQNTVTSIIQDHEGYLWFATLDGLNKYDGYKFTVYKHLPSDSNSLSSNIIWSLYQDKSGYIWVGTVAAGLNRFDPQTETFFHFYHDPADPNSLSGNRVRAICEDRDGFLWIGTRDNGLNKYDPTSGKFIHYKHDPKNPNSLSHNHIRTILPDADGSLWIGTVAGGFNRFDSQTETWARFMIEPNNPHSLNHNHVESLCRDSEGILWVGTYGGGLNRLVHARDLTYDNAEQAGHKKRKTEFIHYTHDDEDPSSISGDVIESVFEDHDGVLWIGTNSGGLNRFDRETETFITYKNEQNNPNGLSFNNVETIFEDASLNLWVGTWGGGLNKLDRKAAKFVHYVSQPNDLNSLCNNYVRAIAREPSGILWVGTSGGGLDRIDREMNDFTHYRYEPDKPNSLSSNDVRSIHIDEDATLWVGTYGGGLNRISLTDSQNRTTGAAQPQLKFKHYKHEPGNPNSLCNDYVWTVLEDSDGIFWLGTNAGFNRFDPKSESFVHYKHEPGRKNSLSSNIVRVILEDHTGSLWLGTYNGLNKFDPESEEFTVYFHEEDNENSLSHSSVMSICETEPGILWFGTLGGGLNKFDVNNGTFDHYFESDGLPNSFVHTIISADNGQLWLSTNNGLSRFDDRLPAGQKFRNYDVHDGLQSNEFNVGAGFKDKSGELFFGGVNGLSCFYPDRIKDNPHIPAVVITEFKVFNEPVALDSAVMNIKEIELSYKDRFFSFEFAALDYTFPGKNQYAYKMEGFDSDWICSGSRRYAGYTNLDPGEYVFRVKGSNNDGLWNEDGASIRIKITPPFWQTWWFRVLALLSAMSLLAFVYRQRIAQLRKAKKTQEEFSRRLIEIQETERQRIASELHDGLGQELLVINHGLQQAAATLPADSATKKDLEQISETTLGAINEVREISSNLHPHQLDRLGLKKAIESMAHRLAQSSNININLELEDLPGFFGKNEEINIYRIIQEGLNNILKHSGADNVLIQFTRSRRAVKFLIQDNGKGFRPKVFDSDLENIQGFGLTNISERVRMLNGKLVIDSSPGHGTTLNIEIRIYAKNRILQ